MSGLEETQGTRTPRAVRQRLREVELISSHAAQELVFQNKPSLHVLLPDHKSSSAGARAALPLARKI